MTFQSTDDSDISVISQNKKCFDNDIVCSKSVLISVGNTEIYLNDAPYKQVSELFLLGSFKLILRILKIEWKWFRVLLTLSGYKI